MKIKLFLIAFLTYLSHLNAQNTLRAYLDVKTFQTTKKESYIEIFNKINAEGLKYKNINNQLIAKVLLKYSIYKNDSLVIQKVDTLLSANVIDSFYNDLFSLKTIFLKPDKYNLKVEYLDLNNELITTPVSNEITVKLLKLEAEDIVISNIQIADFINTTKTKNQFSKYGFDVFPHLGNYLSNECSILPFYYEIYSKDKMNSKSKITYNIIHKESNTIYYKSLDSSIVIKGFLTPVAHAIDIKDLPTGTYDLSIDFQNNQLKTNNKFEFYRYNDSNSNYENTAKILDPNFHKSLKTDSLSFYAKSLMPIMYNDDQKILLKLLKENDSSKIRNFIETFWINTSPMNTFEEWLKYKNQVLLIEKLYKTHNVHGFETERGRVYLKYGPPTTIKTKETSPSEYPYEIWQYDKIKNFANKRFVFYNPDVVGNNFRLLHSDMLGEIKNFKWPGLLTKRNNSTINVDDPLEGGFDHFGGQSRDHFNQY
jgi:GWxTD domain-containing protein